jgi:hypothetical protein
MPHLEYLSADEYPETYQQLERMPHGGLVEEPERGVWDVVQDIAGFVAGEIVEILLPGDQPSLINAPMGPYGFWPGYSEEELARQDETYQERSGEPYGGFLSEALGVIAGTAVGAIARSPTTGFIVGTAVEHLVEGLFEPDSPEWDPGDIFQKGFQGGTGMAHGTGMEPVGNQFAYIKINPQTGLKYGRLMDGRMVYQKKNGTITTYRPKKPIVLMPGSITLSQASRASTALGNIAKRMKKSKFKAFL